MAEDGRLYFSGRAGKGRGGGRALGSRKEGGGGGALALNTLYLLVFYARRATQINLGRLETYRCSGRLVVSLVQGRIRVMSY